MDEKGLGRRLQRARKAAGMTQQSLCHEANISYSTLAKIERGAIKSPSIFTIQSLTNALGISLDALLGTPDSQLATTSSSHHSGHMGSIGPKSISKSGIKFVYFDVNGCLIHFFQRAFISLAHKSGVSADIIEDAFWKYNDAVCRGSMPLPVFNQKLAAVLDMPEVEWRDYFVDAVESVPGMADIVAWTADHYRVGLLTNIMPTFVDALRERGRIPNVAYDMIIDSSQVKAIKPEERIFEIAAERSGFAPHEILLIDDDRTNIMTAERMGWHVLWCDDYEPQETISRIRQALELG